MKISFLQKDAGGVLEYYLADVPSDGSRWDASPAPSVKLLDSSGGEILASTAATTGPSFSLSSDAPSGGKTIPLASSSGIERWEKYLLGPNSSGQWEWITVDGFTSTSATTLEELEYTYASGDAMKSHRLSVSVAASTAGSEKDMCRAEWKYYVNSTVQVSATIFHISVYAPRYSLTASDIIEEFPRARIIKGSNQRIGLMIRTAWERYVLPAIGRMFSPASLVSGEAADEALKMKIFEQLATLAKDTEAADIWREKYIGALDMLSETAIDLDQDGAIEDEETVRGARTPRLIRG